MAMLTAHEALTWALQIEENGEAFYKEVALKSSEPEVKALFEDLAEQERGHKRVFQAMRENAGPESNLTNVDYEEYEDYLETTLNRALFGGPGKGLTLAAEAQDRETALWGAAGFEKDTLLFFYDLRDMVPSSQKETISRVIREEKRHLRQLTSLLQD